MEKGSHDYLVTGRQTRWGRLDYLVMSCQTRWGRLDYLVTGCQTHWGSFDYLIDTPCRLIHSLASKTPEGLHVYRNNMPSASPQKQKIRSVEKSEPSMVII